MKILDFRILSGWIEKYKPDLSKSDFSWGNSYCVRLVIVSLAVNIGKFINSIQIQCQFNFIRDVLTEMETLDITLFIICYDIQTIIIALFIKYLCDPHFCSRGLKLFCKIIFNFAFQLCNQVFIQKDIMKQ